LNDQVSTPVVIMLPLDELCFKLFLRLSQWQSGCWDLDLTDACALA